MTAKCQGLMGLIFGHNFTAHYNETEKLNPVPTINGASGREAEMIIEAHKTSDSIYVHSVCQRCGMVIKDETETMAHV